jgi:hypothetical protein
MWASPTRHPGFVRMIHDLLRKKNVSRRVRTHDLQIHVERDTNLTIDNKKTHEYYIKFHLMIPHNFFFRLKKRGRVLYVYYT